MGAITKISWTVGGSDAYVSEVQKAGKLVNAYVTSPKSTGERNTPEVKIGGIVVIHHEEHAIPEGGRVKIPCVEIDVVPGYLIFQDGANDIEGALLELEFEGEGSEPPEPEENPLLRVAPCSPWVSGPTVLAGMSVKRAIANLQANNIPLMPNGQELKELAEEAATGATEILYERSGRLFTGECGPVKIRPVSHPADVDSKTWGARLSPLGWFSSYGATSSYGSYQPGVVSHYGRMTAPSVYLGAYPIRDIVEVKIDGVVIPSDEYEIQDHSWLVRLRKSPSEPPTERYGWPTSQILDLPDTAPGTFSVEYTYGVPPPVSGVTAARVLAEYLLLPQLGDYTRFPKRVTSASRQGVSAQVTDVMDFLKSDNMLGIYEVDAFLKTYNPHGNIRQALAWSPDLGRARRVVR